MLWKCNPAHTLSATCLWVRVSWCTAWLSSTFWWPLTRKKARASSALDFQGAVAAAVVCFCWQQRKQITQKKGTCSLHIQQVKEKQDWQRMTFVLFTLSLGPNGICCGCIFRENWSFAFSVEISVAFSETISSNYTWCDGGESIEKPSMGKLRAKGQ